jgi:energy-coupling factor transporter transmembrane protein EcfT
LLIILPLIFSTLDRIELISNAMDLRGFFKEQNAHLVHPAQANPARLYCTWYIPA